MARAERNPNRGEAQLGAGRPEPLFPRPRPAPARGGVAGSVVDLLVGIAGLLACACPPWRGGRKSRTDSRGGCKMNSRAALGLGRPGGLPYLAFTCPRRPNHCTNIHPAPRPITSSRNQNRLCLTAWERASGSLIRPG